MSLETIIGHYGYLAILVGAFLEGEAVLLLGALAAQLGYLELFPVIAAASVGSFLGDQLCFAGGRLGGRPLAARLGWGARLARGLRLLRRHQLWVVLGYRFLYGFRTVAAFVIGMSGVPAALFVGLSALAAAVWATAVGVAGYLFGYALQGLWARLRADPPELLMAAALCAVLALLFFLYQQRTGLPARAGRPPQRERR